MADDQNKSAETAPEKPDPAIAPYDQELEAMRQIAIALDQLTTEQRRRVVHWAIARYDLQRMGWC